MLIGALARISTTFRDACTHNPSPKRTVGRCGCVHVRYVPERVYMRYVPERVHTREYIVYWTFSGSLTEDEDPEDSEQSAWSLAYAQAPDIGACGALVRTRDLGMWCVCTLLRPSPYIRNTRSYTSAALNHSRSASLL